MMDMWDFIFKISLFYTTFYFKTSIKSNLLDKIPNIAFHF